MNDVLRANAFLFFVFSLLLLNVFCIIIIVFVYKNVLQVCCMCACKRGESMLEKKQVQNHS